MCPFKRRCAEDIAGHLLAPRSMRFCQGMWDNGRGNVSCRALQGKCSAMRFSDQAYQLEGYAAVRSRGMEPILRRI